MIKKEDRAQSVAIDIDSDWIHERTTWMFCQNGYQSTGVDISVEQFDMLKEMIADPRIVEHYEKLRAKQ